MQKNSTAWHTASTADRAVLDKDQYYLANLLTKLYGMQIERRPDGYWYVTGNPTGGYKVGDKLYSSLDDPFGHGKFTYDPTDYLAQQGSSGIQSGSFKPAGSTSNQSSSSKPSTKPSFSNQSSNNNDTGGNVERDKSVKNIVSQMNTISKKWYHGMPDAEYAKINSQQQKLAESLSAYGISVERRPDGKWYITKDKAHSDYVGRELYQVYKYHVGGVVGSAPGLERNEVLATLQKGEIVIANKDKQRLFDIIKMTSELSKQMSKNFSGSANQIFDQISNLATGNVPDRSNSVSNSISFGDIYIYGSNEETIQKHKEINRKFVNEVVSYLGLKK